MEIKTVKRRGARGDGSICRRKDGRWVGRYTMTLPTGQHKIKVVYGKTQKEAREKLTQAKARRDRGELVDGEGMTVEKFYNVWLAEIAPNYLRATTIETYERLYKKYILPSIGRKHLETLSVGDVQKCINDIAKRSLDQAVISQKALSSMLKRAQKRQYIFGNPARGIELRKPKPKEKEMWNSEELRIFLHQAQETSSYYLAYLLIATYGLRRGEALGIRYKDIDLNDGIIKIRQQVIRLKNSPQIGELKTKDSKRDLPITTSVRGELEKLNFAPHLPSDLIFATRNNTPISPRNFYRDFEKTIKRAGVKKITLHAMRHMFVGFMRDSNIDPKTCQKMLGHSTLVTTLSIYSHTDAEHKAMAVACMDAIISQPII